MIYIVPSKSQILGIWKFYLLYIPDSLACDETLVCFNANRTTSFNDKWGVQPKEFKRLLICCLSFPYPTLQLTLWLLIAEWLPCENIPSCISWMDGEVQCWRRICRQECRRGTWRHDKLVNQVCQERRINFRLGIALVRNETTIMAYHPP